MSIASAFCESFCPGCESQSTRNKRIRNGENKYKIPSPWQMRRYNQTDKTFCYSCYYNPTTKQAYWYRDPQHISILASEIFVTGINFVIAASRMVFYGTRTVVHIGLDIKNIFSNLGLLYRNVERRRETVKDFCGNICEIPSDAVNGCVNIAKAPFFAVALQCIAFYSIFFPFEGWPLYGKVENRWVVADKHEQILIKLKGKSSNLFPIFWEALCNKNSQTCFYLAYCAQPISNVDLVP